MNDSAPIAIEPIGWVRSTRPHAVDDHWDRERSVIELDGARFSPDALSGLADFSHVEIVYCFHLLAPEEVVTGTRHPRGNAAWPAVGIFAQRGRNRPNRLGVSVCAVEAVEGLTLTITGLDAVDGTPVVDLKPYFAEFGPRGPVHQPSWSREVMTDYW